MQRTTARSVVLACAFFASTAPVGAHQKVDPAILKLVEPRTGPPPGNIVRPPDDPLVVKGRRLFFEETFNGNGRTCGTCHRAERNFTIDAAFIRTLPQSDPLFVAETNPALAGLENPTLMHMRGLILENLDGFDQPGVLRSTPHTLGLRFSSGQATGVPLEGALGWSGDGAPGDGMLEEFAVGAVVQHFPKTLTREPGVDFRVPRQDELDALLAFQRALGRQEEVEVASLTFLDTEVAAGQRLFDNAPAEGGTTRSCAFCHDKAGANDADGNGRNFDTGVRLAPDAPACLNPGDAPLDGGFGATPVTMVTLCGQTLPSRGDGKFNTPSLVEAADTPPFFHNNSAATIEDAVRFYNTDAFKASPAGNNRAFALNPTQVGQVAAFLRAVNALDNIATARRALAVGAAQTPSREQAAIKEIGDAIDVLESERPVALFPQAVAALRAAQRDATPSGRAAAMAELDLARGLMVGTPP